MCVLLGVLSFCLRETKLPSKRTDARKLTHKKIGPTEWVTCCKCITQLHVVYRAHWPPGLHLLLAIVSLLIRLQGCTAALKLQCDAMVMV